MLGFWDPLNLAEGEFWGDSEAATIGFLREAEIKHGRVAMAGFVGYIVHANDIRFPWKIPGDVPTGLSPQAVWDAIPEAAKWQIILFVGFLEWWSEFGGTHYMRGGRPGEYPEFKDIPVHKIPKLWDPLNLSKNLSAEAKEKKLLAEVNNGRLAMIGIMSFMAAAKVPGSVPALDGIIAPYSGDVMAPFM